MVLILRRMVASKLSMKMRRLSNVTARLRNASFAASVQWLRSSKLCWTLRVSFVSHVFPLAVSHLYAVLGKTSGISVYDRFFELLTCVSAFVLQHSCFGSAIQFLERYRNFRMRYQSSSERKKKEQEHGETVFHTPCATTRTQENTREIPQNRRLPATPNTIFRITRALKFRRTRHFQANACGLCISLHDERSRFPHTNSPRRDGARGSRASQTSSVSAAVLPGCSWSGTLSSFWVSILPTIWLEVIGGEIGTRPGDRQKS